MNYLLPAGKEFQGKGAQVFQEAAMKKFVKDNDLKLNKETELVQFLSYYEQLTHPSSTVAVNEKN